MLLSKIAGIFDNYRGLIKLARLTCSHATRTLISQIAGNSDSKGFSPFVAETSTIVIIRNCWNFR
ncbi:hypothetical protein [Moorena sp. SIO4G3]|uniref:hypothetical protein n=1 Tax=Moorena sp. SIO4G3 TaxID=2607821 RepID=UPI00142B374F|nr:hypothetical protein [Moorena sp. SIO4G3]NEO78272.1 hypothetical protein [Moorena sp. SIO4G3]